MQWGNWHSAGLLLTSDSKSEGSSALADPGSWSSNNVDGWVSEADSVFDWGSLVRRRRMAQDFIMQLRMVDNLKLMHYLFLKFYI